MQTDEHQAGADSGRHPDDVTALERRASRLAALVLGAERLAARRCAGVDDGAPADAAQRLARLHWAVTAGRAELQRLATTDDGGGAGGR